MKENEELQTLLLTKQVKEGQNLLAGQQKNITRETEDMNNEQVKSNRMSNQNQSKIVYHASNLRMQNS